MVLGAVAYFQSAFMLQARAENAQLQSIVFDQGACLLEMNKTSHLILEANVQCKQEIERSRTQPSRDYNLFF